MRIPGSADDESPKIQKVARMTPSDAKNAPNAAHTMPNDAQAMPNHDYVLHSREKSSAYAHTIPAIIISERISSFTNDPKIAARVLRLNKDQIDMKSIKITAAKLRNKRAGGRGKENSPVKTEALEPIGKIKKRQTMSRHIKENK